MSGLQINAILLSVCIAILIFLAVYMIFYQWGSFQKKTAQRVLKLTEKPKSAMYAIMESKKENASPSLHSGTKFIEYLKNELILANILMKPEEFLVFWIVMIFVPSGLVLLFTSELIPAVTFMILGALLPPFYVSTQKKKRTLHFEAQLSDALMIICNCIRSGLTFQQAMETGVNETSPPISQEFTRVLREIQYGYTMEKALNNMVKRVGSNDLLLTVSAINIQHKTGGNLSDILESISATIKDRQKVKKDIRVLTATGRISGIIIGLLPIFIGVALLIINPDYVKLFFHTELGILMLVVAAIMETIGYLFVKKIVTVKY